MHYLAVDAWRDAMVFAVSGVVVLTTGNSELFGWCMVGLGPVRLARFYANQARIRYDSR